MKYHATLLIVLILVHTNCSPKQSDQSRLTLSLGMNQESALEIIRECGGQDITSNLAMIGPGGERPSSGLFWNLEEYKLVLEIAAENGNVVEIGYWALADFSKSKEYRSKSRKSLKSLMFEKQTRTVKIQES